MLYILEDSQNPDILITDVALHISTYGVEEFKQLVELLRIENKNDLYCCRPLKVVNYLRVRILVLIFKHKINVIKIYKLMLFVFNVFILCHLE